MGNAATAKKGDPENGAYVINIFIYSREDTELSRLLLLVTVMVYLPRCYTAETETSHAAQRVTE